MTFGKRGKYGNTKTVDPLTGVKFDSKQEYNRYKVLQALAVSGAISDLQTQVTFELQPSFKMQGATIRAIKYIADFTYFEGNVMVIEDSKGRKGTQTPEFKLKWKLLQFKNRLNPNVRFLITTG